MLTSVRMGELEPWIDENFIRNLWFQMGEQVSVKMIRDKFSGWVARLHHTTPYNPDCVTGATRGIALSIFPQLKLLQKLCNSVGNQCQTLLVPSSLIGLLAAV